MNAVSRYGAEQIAQTGKVDFLYNEVWGKDNDRTEAKFSHLKTIIDENNEYSGNQLNTVFAAYMNYWLAENVGEFNTPGVLVDRCGDVCVGRFAFGTWSSHVVQGVFP